MIFSIMVLLTVAHSLGMLLGPILAGVMMDVFQLSISFIIGGAIMLLGGVTTLVLTRDFPSPARDSI